ncbi:hypothetical protein AK812_SmicGene9340 [Symbiodinium microadriaticum]|uniref:WW domain-containing protein n=1 Tax=Symbiodinium microadriaticum TaxID=2951 RepID=A0A1Q9EIH9_SYMMI|nr:hypothetical protein AK812_SmicGene9340 [Symbiodinium microadriaticum]
MPMSIDVMMSIYGSKQRAAISSKRLAPPLKVLQSHWEEEDDAPGGEEEEKPDSDAPLLPGWEQHWSEEHSCVYYWHKATKQSSWERPALPVQGGAEPQVAPITPGANQARAPDTPSHQCQDAGLYTSHSGHDAGTTERPPHAASVADQKAAVDAVHGPCRRSSSAKRALLAPLPAADATGGKAASLVKAAHRPIKAERPVQVRERGRKEELAQDLGFRRGESLRYEALTGAVAVSAALGAAAAVAGRSKSAALLARRSHAVKIYDTCIGRDHGNLVWGVWNLEFEPAKKYISDSGNNACKNDEVASSPRVEESGFSGGRVNSSVLRLLVLVLLVLIILIIRNNTISTIATAITIILLLIFASSSASSSSSSLILMPIIIIIVVIIIIIIFIITITSIFFSRLRGMQALRDRLPHRICGTGSASMPSVYLQDNEETQYSLGLDLVAGTPRRLVVKCCIHFALFAEMSAFYLYLEQLLVASEGVVAVSFNENSTGKTFADTKVRYTWELAIDGKMHTTSGKKRVFVDGRLLHEMTVQPVIRSRNFQYSWPIGRALKRSDSMLDKVMDRVASSARSSGKCLAARVRDWQTRLLD